MPQLFAGVLYRNIWYRVLPGNGPRSTCDTPSKVVENDRATLGPPDTDKQVMVHQLNIAVLDKKAPAIDVAVPNDSTISNKELKVSSCQKGVFLHAF